MDGDGGGNVLSRRSDGLQTEGILERITEALGIDVLDLESSVPTSKDSAGRLRENIELLTLFNSIADAETRRACIAFVREAALG